MKRVITGWDIYKIVSIIATLIVCVLLVVDVIWDIGEHSFPGLLVLCFLNVIISFVGLRKKK
ncbi:hypothetical protein CS063_08260 [Sporanaerobium hydrogeniformans]|uniref:Uncharacterized protein n=1 Tax=Sporanaerobium hydrogeniformans TaxID=3072179 RepID=A0AC61DDA5_9FIRM|nr:hypothetical protein [Sporanaerobium hydrogeniformans]PHV70753.1 hypothetical protein CS063_08260 [Sporanaerobium hydrogeniformans]